MSENCAVKTPNSTKKENWHLSKSVPLGIIAALFFQTVSLVWVGGRFSANLEARVASNEKQIEMVSKMPERMARIESTVLNVDRSLIRIERQLDEVKK